MQLEEFKEEYISWCVPENPRCWKKHDVSLTHPLDLSRAASYLKISHLSLTDSFYRIIIHKDTSPTRAVYAYTLNITTTAQPGEVVKPNKSMAILR
jgi:broad specificity polyphosphatase/5'/3'-nucleotidase SurE